MTKTLRQASKTEWSCASEVPSIEAINAGSLQRMADATESMALCHTKLIDKAFHLEASLKYWREYAEANDKRISSLKGQITKLKKKTAA